METLIDKLNNVTWAVLEVNLINAKSPNNSLESLKEDASRLGYNVTGIFESDNQKGLYHLHLNKGIK